MNDIRVIGICGKAFAGKTTIANYLVKNHGFYKTAFAKLLKETARKLYPWLSDEQMFGSLKETVDAKLGITPRKMLQLFGTEVARFIWEDTWIDGLKREITDLQVLQEEISKEGSEIAALTYFPDFHLMAADVTTIQGIVVDDVRFPNEVEAIREIGGEVWVVVRAGSGARGGVQGHESEAHAEEFEKIADHYVDNSGTFDELYGRIEEFLRLE